MFVIFPLCLLLLLGLLGVDTDGVSVFVIEGDSVTLNTGVQTNQQDRIKWYFNNTRIAKITGDLIKICTDVQCNEGTERFRDRLKLDHQTGSLTIMNTRNTDSGVYKLEITSRINSSSTDTFRSFSVTVIDVLAAEMKAKSVKEGESVTLDSGEIKTPYDVIRWYFNDILITEITGDQSKICTDVQCDERFRGRLKLDHQTGSLTITNTRNTDSGEYKLKIINIFRHVRIKRFRVSVTGVALSSFTIAGISAAVLVLLVAAVAALIYCHKNKKEKITDDKRTSSVPLVSEKGGSKENVRTGEDQTQ